jgi:hypothetical protein
VVHEQLRAAVEQLGQRLGALVGLELVVLLDAHPRQLAPCAGELVALTHVRLLALDQLATGLQPFLARPDPVLSHLVPPLFIE